MTYIHKYTHIYTPKESLEIFRQLSPPSVTRVHGDEEPHSGGETDLNTRKQKCLLLVSNSILNTLHLKKMINGCSISTFLSMLKIIEGPHLNCYHREHFN